MKNVTLKTDKMKIMLNTLFWGLYNAILYPCDRC
jgi:hypothetical protein